MAIASPAILPGIRFEPQPPPPGDVLPRMDIAAFVGLAARGPLDVPVAVEDLASFTAVFGSDVVLGDDRRTGMEIAGQLRPAVAGFFRNGGHRCWIVRVAGPTASTLEFPVPGLLRVVPARNPSVAGTAYAATVRASSPGTWAADQAVGAAIDAAPLSVVEVRPPDGVAPDAAGLGATGWRLRLHGSADLSAGDLLRFGLASSTTAFAVLDRVVAPLNADGDRWVTLGAAEAFRTGTAPAGAEGRVRWVGDPPTVTRPARVADPAGDTGETTVVFDAAPGTRPIEATWVRLDIADETWWLPALDVRTALNGLVESTLISGPSFLHLGDGPEVLRLRLRDAMPDPDSAAIPVERLRLTLASGASRLDRPIVDLGLAPGHPRFVGALPSDGVRLGADPRRPGEPRPGALDGRTSPTLAGAGDPGFFVPLAIGPVPLWASRPLAPDADADVDGLKSMALARFVDTRVASVDPARLLAEADFLRYQSPTPTSLRGIHALLDIDEVTLVAVPDASLPRWADEVAANAPLPDLPTAAPDAAETFDPCDPGAPAAPQPRIEWPASGSASFRVAWPPVPHTDGYVIVETTEPASWSPPVEIRRQRPRLEVGNPSAGVHRFRVRGVNEHGAGPWSDWVSADVPGRADATPVPADDPAGSLDLHASLLRMCAARGDIVALLSVPALATPDQVLRHVTELRSRLAPSGPPGARRLPSPDADPLGVLSFGALYHPWIITVADPAATGVRRGRDALPLGSGVDGPSARATPTATGAVRTHPPDGAVAGVFAARARERGAWVAPANVPIRDVVAIDHPVSDGDLVRLHAAGVNVVRRVPSGFLVLAAQTLSEDRILRMTNVRRLLALIRRLALLHGPAYVFEPNSPAFRRRIQRGFEGVLAILFERGAFAGDRASDGYRVSVGDPPNSPQSVDAGRLIVDLRVAPSAPLEFLTVRMVRSGDRFAIEGL